MKDTILRIIESDLDTSTKAMVLEAICGGKSSTSPATPSSVDRHAVVVFTEKRGVFFGYANEEYGPELSLHQARNCYYWSAPSDPKHKGFMGLAAIGPQSGSKVSGPSETPIFVRGITAIQSATDVAIKAWEDASWNS